MYIVQSMISIHFNVTRYWWMPNAWVRVLYHFFSLENQILSVCIEYMFAMCLNITPMPIFFLVVHFEIDTRKREREQKKISNKICGDAIYVCIYLFILLMYMYFKQGPNHNMKREPLIWVRHTLYIKSAEALWIYPLKIFTIYRRIREYWKNAISRDQFSIFFCCIELEMIPWGSRYFFGKTSLMKCNDNFLLYFHLSVPIYSYCPCWKPRKMEKKKKDDYLPAVQWLYSLSHTLSPCSIDKHEKLWNWQSVNINKSVECKVQFVDRCNTTQSVGAWKKMWTNLWRFLYFSLNSPLAACICCGKNFTLNQLWFNKQKMFLL